MVAWQQGLGDACTMVSSFWGVLGGGGLGFALGGPLGALLGALAGHVLVDREGAPFGPAPRELIFTTGLVALAAKMARSDGVVTCDEVTAFRRIVEVPPDQQQRIESLFNLAKQTSAGFEAYAGQIAESFRDEPALLEDVLDGLFLIAAADGAIHEAEHAYLRDVAMIFGIAGPDFARIEARHARRPEDPYLVLGARREMSDPELKRHYRRLVAETHPDREIARGLPEEAVAIATKRLSVINAAWDAIEKERGLSRGLSREPA
jgi:DnaJ like chaperone protein